LDLIRHILEENALDRSKQFIDEVDRQKFIAQKAKELSITEEDLRAIMNSAYLCKPFSYGIIIEDSKEMLNITANTGVAMYSIQYLDSGTQIQYVGSFQANGYSSTSWAPQDKAERRKSLLSILRSAAIDASRKIASKIRASESFLINATVSSATETKIIGNDRILFYFGKEDDVSLDDRYELYENVMGTDGIEDRNI
jgi:methionine synthase I (cobalamin-dependent)